MEKILITPRSFGQSDPAVFRRLEGAGFTVVRNPYGQILTEDQLSEGLSGCVGVIIGVDPLTKTVLNACPQLKAVAKYGVGVDNIDTDTCRERGIPVSRTVGANADAVADFAWTLMLGVARRVALIDRQCRLGDWHKITTMDVAGKTLGLLGLGAIGRKVAQRAIGFGIKVLAYDPIWDDEYARTNSIERAEVEEIYAQSDFISLHLPLIPQTRHMIGAAEIALMKPQAIIINTARGGLIDEGALYDALVQNKIYGAGMDAFSHEPLEDKRWYDLENVIIGSHAAASTFGATEQMGQMAVTNIIRDLSNA